MLPRRCPFVLHFEDGLVSWQFLGHSCKFEVLEKDGGVPGDLEYNFVSLLLLGVGF